MLRIVNYKVVQIWPGQTVTCLHTNSPGHIWTTLYFCDMILCYKAVEFIVTDTVLLLHKAVHEQRVEFIVLAEGFWVGNVSNTWNKEEYVSQSSGYIKFVTFRVHLRIHLVCTKRQENFSSISHILNSFLKKKVKNIPKAFSIWY
jgi:hypothetical protein